MCWLVVVLLANEKQLSSTANRTAINVTIGLGSLLFSYKFNSSRRNNKQCTSAAAIGVCNIFNFRRYQLSGYINPADGIREVRLRERENINIADNNSHRTALLLWFLRDNIKLYKYLMTTGADDEPIVGQVHPSSSSSSSTNILSLCAAATRCCLY